MARFHDVPPISREEATAAFATGRGEAICAALVAVTFHDPDWRWVQAHCLRLAQHRDDAVRAVAATCLGHLARIHRALEADVVLPVLRGLAKDPAVCGYAEDALDDVRQFLRPPAHVLPDSTGGGAR
ncbi:MAG TPA: hypothetical protein VFL91_07510 [Thermomicrobiales bacterium]|nr:hypothetical protein [Thermomicrobiales bacterium]